MGLAQLVLAMGAAWVPALAALAAPDLPEVCTTAYVRAALPIGAIQGADVDSLSVTANAVRNFSVAATGSSIGVSGRDFCNVTFSYARTGRGDKVSPVSTSQGAYLQKLTELTDLPR